MLGGTEVAATHPWVPVPFVVLERKSETPDTITLVLAP